MRCAHAAVLAGLFLSPAGLFSCSPVDISVCGTHADCGPLEVCLDGVCREVEQDCPDRDCPDGYVCFELECIDPACLGVVCADDEACAGGQCYPKDCPSRSCPGLGEVCVDEECLPVSCLEITCPEGQRCAAGNCYPIDCQTKVCAGYGEVCIEGECIERSCVGVECPPRHDCAGGYCYPSDCADTGCPGEDQVCVDGVCQNVPCIGVICPPGQVCADGWCYPEDCEAFECGDGELCLDGQCIHTECVSLTCGPDQICLEGECIEDPCLTMVCDDGDPCTDDICVAGECAGRPAEAGTPCDDGLFCTIADACDGLGSCTGEARDCSALTDQCTQGLCHEEADACVSQPINEGLPCDDGQYCTADEICREGKCIGANLTDCDDADPCTLDTCDEVLDFCDHRLVPDPGTEGLSIPGSCSDGIDNDCDRLVDGDDPDCQPCQVDADCDDGNQCTVNSCNSSHQCETVTEPNGTACDDGRFCSHPDGCLDGFCNGPERDCSHLNDLCLLGACNESADQCEALPLVQGSLCDDGIYCNGADQCDDAGGCEVHAGDPCSDGPACNSTCNEGEENCFDPAGTACGDPSDGDCDNPDSCDASGACLANLEPAGTICRGAVDDCDAVEFCDGASFACPPDLFLPDLTACAGSAGVCCSGNCQVGWECCVDGDCSDSNSCTIDTCEVGACIITCPDPDCLALVVDGTSTGGQPLPIELHHCDPGLDPAEFLCFSERNRHTLVANDFEQDLAGFTGSGGVTLQAEAQSVVPGASGVQGVRICDELSNLESLAIDTLGRSDIGLEFSIANSTLDDKQMVGVAYLGSASWINLQVIGDALNHPYNRYFAILPPEAENRTDLRVRFRLHGDGVDPENCAYVDDVQVVDLLPMTSAQTLWQADFESGMAPFTEYDPDGNDVELVLHNGSWMGLVNDSDGAYLITADPIATSGLDPYSLLVIEWSWEQDYTLDEASYILLEISVDNGSSWLQIAGTGHDFAPGAMVTDRAVLPCQARGIATLLFRFHGPTTSEAGGDDGTFIDNVSLREMAPEYIDWFDPFQATPVGVYHGFVNSATPGNTTLTCRYGCGANLLISNQEPASFE
jgi:hypothetical protein